MTDTNSNPTINDTDARIDLLTEQIERLSGMLAKFADGAVALLSGEQQTAPQARRRGPGRPPKARPVAETPAEKPYHDIARRSLELVTRNGVATQADLAHALNVENSAIAHHMKRVCDDDKAVKVKMTVGGREVIAFFRPDKAPKVK